MLFSFKKIPAIILLLSFLALAIFSFAMIGHEPDGTMREDCPFATFAGSASLCPQDMLAVAVHHVSAYSTFLNVPVPVAFGLMLTALLALAYIAFFSYTSAQILSPRVLRKWKYYSPPNVSLLARKIARWLSLLEHSPSAT